MIKLLVVDDVAERISDIRQEVLFSFPGTDIDVLGARDVPEALELFHERNGDFDMIVLDLRLPPFSGGAKDEEGGFYLLRQFATLAPEVMYVLSSGSLPDGERPADVLPPGFPPENFHCIPKSAKREALLAILEDLIARKSSPQAAMVG